MITNYDQLSSNAPNERLISLQLSYSTGDIEQNIFYQNERKPVVPIAQPTGKATLLVVHGELFALEENLPPGPSTPLSEESGIFRIVALAR